MRMKTTKILMNSDDDGGADARVQIRPCRESRVIFLTPMKLFLLVQWSRV